MIVLPPETFEKWKHMIVEDSKLSLLDKEMKKILYDKNLNVLDKWHRYRQNLLHYIKKNKPTKNYKDISTNTVKESVNVGSQVKLPLTRNKRIQMNTDQKPTFNQSTQTYTENVNAGTQMKFPLTRNSGMQTYTDHLTMGTQTFPNEKLFMLPKKKATFKQSKVVVAKKDSSLSDFNNTSIYEHLGDKDLSKDDIFDVSSESIIYDQDDSIRKKALEGQTKDVRIVKERMSTNPNEYRSYDLSNGEIVTVPLQKRKIITRSLSNQQLLKGKKRKSHSTPVKKKQSGGKIKWVNYK